MHISNAQVLSNANYSPEMFVVQNLRQETLRSAIAQALEDGSFYKICAFIGTTNKVYDGRIDYEAMQVWQSASPRGVINRISLEFSIYAFN